jgi:hypothetical protein
MQGVRADRARGLPAPDIVYWYNIGYLRRGVRPETGGPVLVSNGMENVDEGEKEQQDSLCKRRRGPPAPNIEQTDNNGRKERG